MTGLECSASLSIISVHLVCESVMGNCLSNRSSIHGKKNRVKTDPSGTPYEDAVMVERPLSMQTYFDRPETKDLSHFSAESCIPNSLQARWHRTS